MNVVALLELFEKYILRIRSLTYEERLAECEARWSESDNKNVEKE